MGQHFFCQFGHGGIRFSRLGILMVGIVGTPVYPDVLFAFFRCVAAIHLKFFIQIIAHGLGHTHHLINGIFSYFPGSGGHTDDRLIISQLSVCFKNLFIFDVVENIIDVRLELPDKLRRILIRLVGKPADAFSVVRIVVHDADARHHEDDKKNVQQDCMFLFSFHTRSYCFSIL